MSLPPPDEQQRQPPGTFGPSSEAFLASKKLFRVLIGGRGSSKTYTVIDDICRHLWHNAGGKAILARQIDDSNRESTIPTLRRWFEDHGPQYTVAGSGGLFKMWADGVRVRVPSRLAIEELTKAAPQLHSRAEIALWIQNVGARLCGTIEHRGLKDSASGGKLRGMECSYLAFIEADQIEERFFKLGLACLRWKGADPAACDENGFIRDRSVVLDTNPPGTKHWIAEMEERETAKPEAERTMDFWHISTRENEHNLPANYIRDFIELPYGDNPAMLDRMLHGKYADAYEGKPVFHSYRAAEHEGQDLPWPKGAYLVRGWDWGTTNATTWLAYWHDAENLPHIHALHEQYLTDSDTDRQAALAVASTASEFPFWNDRDTCAGVLDYCDPAGRSRMFGKQIVWEGKKIEQSAINILRTHGIVPGYRTTGNGLQDTIAIVNRLLQLRDSKGRPCFKIDTKNCPRLADAFRGGYRYPVVGEPGFGKDEPLKGPACDGLDHLSDAFRYATINLLRIANNKLEPIKAPAYAGRSKKPMNPMRRL